MKSNIIKIIIIVCLISALGKVFILDDIIVSDYNDKTSELSSLKEQIQIWKTIDSKYGDKLRTDEELDTLVKDGFGSKVSWSIDVTELLESIGYIEETTVDTSIGEEFHFSRVSNGQYPITVENLGASETIMYISEVKITISIRVSPTLTTPNIEDTIEAIHSQNHQLYNINDMNFEGDSKLTIELIGFYK